MLYSHHTAGGTYPLFYELSVELTFPVAEATSAGVLTLVSNLWSLIFLFVAPGVCVGICGQKNGKSRWEFRFRCFL